MGEAKKYILHLFKIEKLALLDLRNKLSCERC